MPPRRSFDPDAIVHQQIASRRGVLTQAEIERQARAERRLGATADEISVIPGQLEVTGHLVFHGGQLIWPLTSSTDVDPFEIILQDPGIGADILWIGRDAVSGNFVTRWYDNSPQVMLEINYTTGKITIGGQQSMLSGYDPVGAVTTYTLDNRTGDITSLRHIIAGGSAPSATVGTAMGTGRTMGTVSGCDQGGTAVVNTGTGATAGQVASFTFANAFTAAPHSIIAQLASAAGPELNFYVTGITTTGFDVNCRAAPNSSSAFTFRWMVVG